MQEILLIDDESKLLRFFQKALIKKGYEVTTAANGQEARRKVTETNANLVFLDLKLPDASGMDLLQEFVALYPHKIFIMMTAYGDIENAVAAMKAGAFEYMVKPVKLDDMISVIEKAFKFLNIKEEKGRLKEKLNESDDDSIEMLGVSSEMKQILDLVKIVAPSKASVLLEGESGTGKSMIAKKIHKLSDRSGGPFISVNCAAIPEQLLESELFGHEKGAFTGAVSSRMGKFEAANHGTLFLDEIGEITPSFQAKLLQVVQDKEFMRVGSDQLKWVDVRLITATNKNLNEMVEEGQFREDLYYRLNVIDINIPPLRERKKDIPFLIEKFLKRYGNKLRQVEITTGLMETLVNYSWPGNVRQLENSIERAVILCRGEQLSINDFPVAIRQEDRVEQALESSVSGERTLRGHLDELEKKLILKALDDELGQAAAAAKKLGISKQNFLYKMNKYFPKG